MRGRVQKHLKVYTYLDEANTLDAPKIFKCLILFNIMRFPMIMLPNVINWALRAQVSLRPSDPLTTPFINWLRCGTVQSLKTVCSKSLTAVRGSLLRRIEKFLHLPELEENDFKNEPKSWIKIENGNFNWGDENTTLKNINLEVKPNKLVAIVGSVGSGKSSLVQVLVRNDWLSESDHMGPEL